MTGNQHLFRYASIKGKDFLPALKHNKRELQKGYGAKAYIDEKRMGLNYSLYGLTKADEIYNYARSQIALAGILSVRKNAIWAIECIFSLPVSYISRDSRPFFEDCLTWVKESFNGELLSFDIHLDESAPHAHALILPLLDGRLQGDKIKGGRAVVLQRQDSFYAKVAHKYGFATPQRLKICAEDISKIAKAVIQKLETDSAINSAIYSWIRDQVHKDPIPVAQLLEIPIALKQNDTKHFVDIKRSKGHGTFIR